MNKYILLLLALSSSILVLNSQIVIASETLTVQLPDNTPMNFQPVFLDIDGDKIFSSQKMRLGSRDGDDVSYKERLSITNLGGAFVGPDDKGEKKWFYYLGQTEVSVRQFNAVMRWWQEKNSLVIEAQNTSLVPQTGKTPAEIFMFIEALNVYLLQTQKHALPKNGNAVGISVYLLRWNGLTRRGAEIKCP
ncbi:hypothetical protein CS022_13615 [Veronia nyctiphanis]|uniref:Uncharacterized protein n=1 Tax=Veronia nyctiphanis TaxID=1278244 RepID=A0A4Q0YPD1_9GAMM|nr:hypothetical protein [Veronia nyctiphanis]RXJ72880.1 hypothetical protein CS022_13615 [Veronia nyctiphanis]